MSHAEQVELAAVVHVTDPAQWLTDVQSGHVSAVPCTRYRPLAHVVHCDVVGAVHVTGALTHPVMGEHAEQDDGTVAFKWKPAAQLVQNESLAVVHVTADVHWVTEEHGRHEPPLK